MTFNLGINGVGLGSRPSNVPSWANGMDMYWDLTNQTGYPTSLITDIHPQAQLADDTAGNYSSFAIDTLVRTNKGVQTVPTRTNSLRNNTMVGAVAGSPGTAPTGWSVIGNNGLSVASMSLEASLGFTVLAVTWTGTASATGGIFTEMDVAGAIAASVGQVWTQSWFMSLTVNSGATPTFVSRISYRDAGDVSLGQTDGAFVPTESLARYSNIGGGAPASTASIIPTLRTGVTNGLTYNYTVRIAVPQLELGAFASAPILTRDSAVTVTGNKPVIDLTGKLALGVRGIVQVDMKATPSSGATRLLEISNGLGGAGSGVILYYASGNLRMQVFTLGVGQGSVDLGTWPSGVATIAFAAGTNYCMGRIVGQSAPSADTTVTWPSGLVSASLGGEGATAGQNGYQFTRRLALGFGAQDATTYADAYAKAQILDSYV